MGGVVGSWPLGLWCQPQSQSLSSGLWILDLGLGFGTWIWDLDLGLTIVSESDENKKIKQLTIHYYRSGVDGLSS